MLFFSLFIIILSNHLYSSSNTITIFTFLFHSIIYYHFPFLTQILHNLIILLTPYYPLDHINFNLISFYFTILYYLLRNRFITTTQLETSKSLQFYSYSSHHTIWNSMQYQDISIVPDVALPYSGHTDHDKSVEGVSLRTNMNNSTSEPVSSSTTLQEMGSKARESKVTNTDALRFEWFRSLSLSNEAIAQYNTSHSLVGMLISLLKKHSTLSLRELRFVVDETVWYF